MFLFRNWLCECRLSVRVNTCHPVFISILFLQPTNSYMPDFCRIDFYRFPLLRIHYPVLNDISYRFFDWFEKNNSLIVVTDDPEQFWFCRHLLPIGYYTMLFRPTGEIAIILYPAHP